MANRDLPDPSAIHDQDCLDLCAFEPGNELLLGCFNGLHVNAGIAIPPDISPKSEAYEQED